MSLVGTILAVTGTFGLARMFLWTQRKVVVSRTCVGNYVGDEAELKCERTFLPFVYICTITSQDLSVCGQYFSWWLTRKEKNEIFKDLVVEFNNLIDEKNGL